MSAILDTYRMLARAKRAGGRFHSDVRIDLQMMIADEMVSWIGKPTEKHLRYYFIQVFSYLRMHPEVARRILDEHPELIAQLLEAHGSLSILCVDEESFKKLTFLLASMNTEDALVRGEIKAFFTMAHKTMPTVAEKYIDFYASILDM